MDTMTSTEPSHAHPLRVARVLGVTEQVCTVWETSGPRDVPFATTFPAPRKERVAPGHLAAVATGPDGADVVVWRWYDAVVLGSAEGDDTVRLWEPAHGEVTARRRRTDAPLEPGTRAFASAGLPGADWWVNGPADRLPRDGAIDLAQVESLYTDNGLWESVFGS